jgi:hypothetical protein
MIISSRGIKFTTTEYVAKRSKANLVNFFKKVFEIYNQRGFNIQTALMDREFECLRDDIRGVVLNTTATSEHVPEIERQIRVVKERARAIWSTLPFNAIPNRMIVELVICVVLWLNAFPPSSGVSKTYSHRTIMTSTTLDYSKHCKLPFGAYVQTQEENNPTNNMKERTCAAICLGPKTNFQGSYKFLCLRTGRRITRKQFKELPMPASVIKSVEALTERDKKDGNLEFTDRHGNSFVDNQYVGDANQPADGGAGVDEEDTLEHEQYDNEPEQENNDTDDEAPGIHMDIPGVTEENIEIPGLMEDIWITGVPENTPGVSEGISGVPVETTTPCECETEIPADPGPPHKETEEHTTGPESSERDESTAPPAEDEHENDKPLQLTSRKSTTDNEDSGDDEEEEEQGKEIPDDKVYHPDTMTPSIQSTYRLRSRRARDYSHMHANIVNHAMTQYSLNKGLRKFQNEGEKAVEKELEKLHMKETFAPVNEGDLTARQKKSALESLMFLKEKRDGYIKGRACADGRKQREGSTKSDATSPTVALESVLITATIDAFEKREVAIVDVPGAYLTADMDEEVFMCIRGKLAELMVKTAPDIYRNYIYVGPDNKPVLYVKLQKALYGCLRSALLFYLKLLKDLEGNGFKLNPYDPCVANKMVNGKQFTITWHVDDLKLSHVDVKEVDKTIEWLKSIYGEDMRVSRGKKHDYL